MAAVSVGGPESPANGGSDVPDCSLGGDGDEIINGGPFLDLKNYEGPSHSIVFNLEESVCWYFSYPAYWWAAL